MPRIKNLLNEFTIDELRGCVFDCLLPISYGKSELIGTLLDGYRPSQVEELFGGFTAKELKRICSIYGLAVSGSKGDLIERIMEITTFPDDIDTKRKRCRICAHLYDRREMQKHHFIPKEVSLTKWDYIGGVIHIDANCHSLLHRLLDEVRAKKVRPCLKLNARD
jgi:hypothetical protein